VSAFLEGLRRIALWPLAVRPRRLRCDVIVVLGAALAPDGRLGPAVAERVAAGVRAYRAGTAPLMLMTGAIEATAMRRVAIACGVPSEAILVEEMAATTRQNAVASARLMRAHGLRRALIVTQRFHLRRSVAAFRRAGVEVEPLLLPIGRGNSLPQIAREYVALAAYTARGWLRF
jgi:uncharacterized SAM-binding protein YcdF (DUF218 family)